MPGSATSGVSRSVRAGGWEAQGRNRDYPQSEVVTADDHTPVGVTTLQIDSAVRTAEYVILLAPEARGKGLATEATALPLRWAFEYAALRMLWRRPDSSPPTSTAAVRLLAWAPL
ncbi:GNAT family N-acetyltransferase [Peterkaempfera bronchialis]|uniref:GNAT family N-acetyltransferase n=1 Tax=Peterkaempfera bronchialis TaxID=2126346 RepID=UPI003C2C9AD8